MKTIIQLLFFALLSCAAFSQNVEFEDDIFKDYLISQGIDTNGDGEIQLTEAEVLTQMEIRNSDASSLVGIKSFVNLETIILENEEIPEIDLSEMGELVEVQVLGICNSMIFNASRCNKLEIFNAVSDASIDSIIINNCPVLNTFEFDDLGDLRFVDISTCPDITELQTTSPEFVELDVSGCIGLQFISGAFNLIGMEDLVSLRHLDFATERNLTIFDFPLLERIDLGLFLGDKVMVRNCPVLVEINISSSYEAADQGLFYELEVSEAPSLLRIIANEGNALKNIFATGLSSLDFIDLNYENIDSVDLSNNPKLESIFIPPDPIDYVNMRTVYH